MKCFFKKYFLIFLLLSAFIYAFYEITPVITNKKIEDLNLDTVNKLMIVAHPDDETIWGGAHIIDDDYLVVCVTCGQKRNRVREFKQVMKFSKNKYLMLGYPDKKRGIRSDWIDHIENIQSDLQSVIDYKKWDLVVTHNPDGEYGHEHHKMISRIVTNNYSSTQKLYYFGKYYKPNQIKEIKNDLIKIDDKLIEKKYQMINKYKTQSFIKKRFSHMFDYENWISYNKWYTYIARS